MKKNSLAIAYGTSKANRLYYRLGTIAGIHHCFTQQYNQLKLMSKQFKKW